MASQRHATVQSEVAEQGYAYGGEVQMESFVEMKVKHDMSVRKRSIFETLGWLATGALVLWYGNGKRDFIYVVLHDPRLRKQEFFVGCLCVLVNAFIFLYLAVWVRVIKQDLRDFNLVVPGAIPTAAILGISSYCIFVYSMWPIWGWIIIPMLYILFMTFVVMAPYIPPYTKKKD